MVEVDGQRVRQYRLAQQLTQAELAERTSGAVSRSYIGSIESDARVRVSPEVLAELAQALGVRGDDLQPVQSPRQTGEVQPVAATLEPGDLEAGIGQRIAHLITQSELSDDEAASFGQHLETITRELLLLYEELRAKLSAR